MTDALHQAQAHFSATANTLAGHRAELRSAHARRSELIAAAAKGAPVEASHLMETEADAREAQARHDISEAIHAAARANLEKAQIAAWHDESERLTAALDAAADARVAAAVAVESALAALLGAIDTFQVAGANLQNARASCSHFNQAMETEGRGILADMAPNLRPKVRGQFNQEIRRLAAAVYQPNGWMDSPQPVKGIAAHEASLWSRPNPAAATPR